MSKALIVVDMQNDFCAPGGALTTPEAQAIVPRVRELVFEFLRRGDFIYFTQDTHRLDYLKTQEGRNLPVEHCIKGTWGWFINVECDIKELAENTHVKHLCKRTFGYDDWESEFLDQYEEVVICGVCTDICVISNIVNIKTFNSELPIKVYADACAGVTPEKHAAALEVMKSLQVEVIERKD